MWAKETWLPKADTAVYTNTETDGVIPSVDLAPFWSGARPSYHLCGAYFFRTFFEECCSVTAFHACLLRRVPCMKFRLPRRPGHHQDDKSQWMALPGGANLTKNLYGP